MFEGSFMKRMVGSGHALRISRALMVASVSGGSDLVRKCKQSDIRSTQTRENEANGSNNK